MKIKDLTIYDAIAVWGLGKAFKEKFRKQFAVDYLVDSNDKLVGQCIYHIPVISVRQLVEETRDKKVLIVISSNQYYFDIVSKMKDLGIECDYVKLSDMLAVYGRSYKSVCLWGMDALVKDILVRTGFCMEQMSYIEIGAAHPILGSATEIFYLEGARGILIEPNPDWSDTIKEARPEDCCLVCGIGKQKGNMKFYRFEDNEYRGSFDITEVNKNIKRGYTLKDEIDIPVVTIDDIIQENNVDTANTYLSIQVMGSELDALEGFSYEKWDFPVISIAFYDDAVLEHPIFQYYREIARIPRHIVLVKEDIYNKIYN